MRKYKEATELIETINVSLEIDGGDQFRTRLKYILPRIDDAYRSQGSPYRKHLGASVIGNPCSRALWYGFRWALIRKFGGRVIRLFNRGHLEEARFIALLETAGLEVWYENPNGGQFRFTHFGGHFGSALDSVVRGVPGFDKKLPMYAEFKTAKDSVFNSIQKDGVRIAKPEHYDQIQVCMLKMELTHALYMVVNKDNDELHAEVVELNIASANASLDRAEAIIFSRQAPPRISKTPSWYQCKMCDYRGVCFKSDTPEINCRTCEHAKPEKDGTWSCSVGKNEVIAYKPEHGCLDYKLNHNMDENYDGL